MNFEVIQALRAASTGFTADIEKDYIHLAEARQASNVLQAALDKCPPIDGVEELYALQVDSECAHEEQGFINGFRMGVRLMSECTMSAPLDIYHPDERGNVAPITPAWAKEGK